ERMGTRAPRQTGCGRDPLALENREFKPADIWARTRKVVDPKLGGQDRPGSGLSHASLLPPSAAPHPSAGHGFSQKFTLTRKMLSGFRSRSARASWRRSKAPTESKSPTFPVSRPDRDCCHTRKIVLPGRHSQRRTAFPSSERTLKSA